MPCLNEYSAHASFLPSNMEYWLWTVCIYTNLSPRVENDARSISKQKKPNCNWLILNKSWRQHPTKHQQYGHLPPITKSIQVRRTRHAGHCWRSRDELISDVLLWAPIYGRSKAGRPARTYIQQVCEDTGCSPEDLPEAMNDREKWQERVRDIRACDTTWWWWCNWLKSIFTLFMIPLSTHCIWCRLKFSKMIASKLRENSKCINLKSG